MSTQQKTFDDEHSRMNDQVFRHATTIPPPEGFQERCSIEPGCKQWNPSTYAVMHYDKVAPITQKAMTRERARNTELFGGPFRGLHGGDGLKYKPDAWSDAWEPNTKFYQQCDKRLSETNYNRFHCIDGLPLTWEGAWWHGADTRQGNQLICKPNY